MNSSYRETDPASIFDLPPYHGETLFSFSTKKLSLSAPFNLYYETSSAINLLEFSRISGAPFRHTVNIKFASVSHIASACGRGTHTHGFCKFGESSPLLPLPPGSVSTPSNDFLTKIWKRQKKKESRFCRFHFTERKMERGEKKIENTETSIIVLASHPVRRCTIARNIETQGKRLVCSKAKNT